jgi:ABC-type multidrug transport system ATPase subunit
VPTTFSRGLRQKAAIALALMRPFQVLLVDEPFVGLDQAGKDTLLELLDEAAAGGATLLVATHELAFVHRVQRLLALRDGALVYDGHAHGHRRALTGPARLNASRGARARQLFMCPPVDLP